MVSNPKRLGIIPARGGSKRIPRKNIKNFAGEPSLTRIVKALFGTELFDRVLISTEDDEIAALGKELGAEVVKRSRNLADDFVTTTTVMKDLLGNLHLKAPDPWVYMFYATSPTTSKVVGEFVKFTESEPNGFAITVAKSSHPVQRAMEFDDTGRLTFREPTFAKHRTQDLEPAFFDAGKFYGAKKSDWLNVEIPLLSSPRGFVVPEWMSIDMDTIEDWEIAEYKFRREFEL